jgi:hypothetical protein
MSFSVRKFALAALCLTASTTAKPIFQERGIEVQKRAGGNCAPLLLNLNALTSTLGTAATAAGTVGNTGGVTLGNLGVCTCERHFHIQR